MYKKELYEQNGDYKSEFRSVAPQDGALGETL
jgi:hypothetical protein